MWKLIFAYLMDRSSVKALAIAQEFVKEMTPAHRAELVATVRFFDAADRMADRIVDGV